MTHKTSATPLLKRYYDVLSMEIWQECWKFKAYQEVRNIRLAGKRSLVGAHQEEVEERDLEKLRIPEADRGFHDRQKLKELEERVCRYESYIISWDVEYKEPYYEHLHASWKEWLFYHTSIYFPSQPQENFRKKYSDLLYRLK